MNLNLEVNGLTKRYKNSDFYLDNVSFSVPKGAIVGFIGENGAGKTTTINSILGTLIKDGGQVKVFDEEMTNDSANLRDDIGVVFDASSFGHFVTPINIATVMRSIYGVTPR